MTKVIFSDGSERKATNQEKRLLGALNILYIMNDIPDYLREKAQLEFSKNANGVELRIRANGILHGSYHSPIIEEGENEKEVIKKTWNFVYRKINEMRDVVNSYDKFMNDTQIKCCGIYYTDETECDNCGGNPQCVIDRG